MDEEEKKQNTFDTSSKILEIVLQTINEKFGSNFLVFYQIWKLVKNANFIDQEFKAKTQDLYKSKKRDLFN
mgnify:CR=1 FL=1